MLAEGSLTAYGRPDAVEELLPIPAHSWRYLRWGDAKSGTVSGAGRKFYDGRVARGAPLSTDRNACANRAPRETVDMRGTGEGRGFGSSELPREAVASLGACDDPLQIAVDTSSSTVVILGIGELTGKNFELILALCQHALVYYFERKYQKIVHLFYLTTWRKCFA